MYHTTRTPSATMDEHAMAAHSGRISKLSTAIPPKNVVMESQVAWRARLRPEAVLL